MKEITNFLDKEECEYLIEFIENFKHINNVELNRNVEVYSFDTTDLIPNLNKKLNEIDIINNPPFNINKYTIGSFFERHRDSGGKNDSTSERVKTLIINLSNEGDYEGGDLIINDNIVTKKLGNAFLFSSAILHELKNITSGVRYSLVIWLKDNNLKKSII